MELSCYAFELQYCGISVVGFEDCTDCLQILYMHRGPGLAFPGAWLGKMGTRGG